MGGNISGWGGGGAGVGGSISGWGGGSISGWGGAAAMVDWLDFSWSSAMTSHCVTVSQEVGMLGIPVGAGRRK